MTGRRRREPVSLGMVVGQSRALRRRGPRVDHDLWRRAVGHRVARRTAPGPLRDGVLTVYVASAVWAQELSLLSPAIVDKLRAASLDVARLRFRVGTIDPPDDSHIVEQHAAPKAALPPDLERRLQGVEDSELREAIAEAAAYSLGRNTSEKKP